MEEEILKTYQKNPNSNRFFPWRQLQSLDPCGFLYPHSSVHNCYQLHLGKQQTPEKWSQFNLLEVQENELPSAKAETNLMCLAITQLIASLQLSKNPAPFAEHSFNPCNDTSSSISRNAQCKQKSGLMLHLLPHHSRCLLETSKRASYSTQLSQHLPLRRCHKAWFVPAWQHQSPLF